MPRAKIPPSLAHLPASIRKLCLHGSEAMKAQKVNGRWRGPAVSARKAARVRKNAVKSGTFGTFDPTTGVGWDPAWDAVGKLNTMMLRRPKGHVRERTREARAQRIEEAMETMDERIEKHRQNLDDMKPTGGIEQLIKDVTAKARKKR